MTTTIADLSRELTLLGATAAVVASDMELGKRNGLPRANQTRLPDPAVALYFVRDGQAVCIPSDRWNDPLSNLRAIGKSVEAIRGLERWGAGEMVSAAFRGFAALPEPRGDGWWTVLGTDPGATRDQVEAAYRRLAREVHPDVGGSEVAFRAVQRAYEQAKGDRP